MRKRQQKTDFMRINAVTLDKEVDSEPPVDSTLLNEEERNLSPDDTYFKDGIDPEFYEKFNINDDLSYKEKFIFYKLFRRYRNNFAFKGDPLGRIDVWTHKIDTGDNPPIKSNQYRVSDKERQVIAEAVNDMLEKGVIEPCSSSWASPVTLVPKKDGTIRFCIDYRKLNAITKDDIYPIPILEEPLSLMRGCDRFSVMDADSCFWQIPIHPESQEKTAFICHMGTFLFKVLPFGLKTAPM